MSSAACTGKSGEYPDSFGEQACHARCVMSKKEAVCIRQLWNYLLELTLHNQVEVVASHLRSLPQTLMECSGKPADLVALLQIPI